MKPNRPVLIALAVGFSLMLGAAALSQTPMDDPLDARDARRLDRMERVVRELRSIVFQARDTGQPVVVQPAGTEERVTEMSERLASMEQTLTRLNGQLETVGHDVATTRQALTAAQRENQQLVTRIAALEQQIAQLSAPPPQVEAPLAERPPRNGAQAGEGADRDFTAARRLLLDGDYAAAEGAFETWLAEYPEAARAAEARYYYGKTLLARRAYQEAATAYLGAIREWPQTSWAPDAVLDLARALNGMGNKADACRTLGELSRRYPRASTDVRNRAAALRTQAGCQAQ